VTCDQQDNVHNPPDAQSAQGDQFSGGDTGLTQAEPINAEHAQKYWIEKGIYKIVSAVSEK